MATNLGRRVPTHPPLGLHDRIVRLWRSSFTGSEIATDLGLKPITVYMIWSKAKRAGRLPRWRRPTKGF